MSESITAHLNPIRPNVISISMMQIQASGGGWELLSDSHVFPAAVGHGGDTDADIIDADRIP